MRSDLGGEEWLFRGVIGWILMVFLGATVDGEICIMLIICFLGE
jgi:hypothetical protein